MSSLETMLSSGYGKRIAVLGDPMLDVWVPCAPAPNGRESPVILQVGKEVRTPGGAANAARQLQHWGVEVTLIPPTDDFSGPARQNPIKTRYLDPQGRLLLRVDWEEAYHGMSPGGLILLRERAVKTLREGDWDAVYVADYAKGFLDDDMVRCIATGCRERGIPCVIDPKRPSHCCQGAVLKCNGDYVMRYGAAILDHAPATVVTYAQDGPAILDEGGTHVVGANLPTVPCVNHVGAGDCFGVHLTLALACGMPLVEAARIAHAAGRVYVQHPHGRPPWPHEVARDLDPVGGKLMTDVDALRQSMKGKRVVFTNGVFRVPHAGHAWLLDWARRQGDILIVGINDDASAARVKPGQPCLPLAERAAMLTGLACVDWVVPFARHQPDGVTAQLRPDVLVKGHEYKGTTPPGAEHAGEVRFAPASPFPRHSADIIEALRA